jgi:hypothetical protein
VTWALMVASAINVSLQRVGDLVAAETRCGGVSMRDDEKKGV